MDSCCEKCESDGGCKIGVGWWWWGWRIWWMKCGEVVYLKFKVVGCMKVVCWGGVVCMRVMEVSWCDGGWLYVGL